jgi:arabinogalactan endo-1,4-beta-galactosidase
MTPRINPIGISAHLEGLSQTDATKQLDLMQQAGINWIRLEFHWNNIEPTQGTWGFSKYDYLVSGILSRGMQIIGLLSQYHVPTWYGTPSNKPPLPQDYAAWISSVASRYAGQIPLYEIGNEPNSNGNWYPQASASAYTALLQAAYPAIKSADNNAKIISGGLSPSGAITPENFLTQMYASGVQGYMDYIGYHPYSWPASPDFTQWPPTFSELANLKNIMTANGDGNKQIMATEVGWPTYPGGDTEANQATYIGRVYQKIMHEGYQYVAIACIYDFLDDGTDANNPEDHFGLLRTDYSQKPSYSSMQSARADYNANFTPINP